MSIPRPSLNMACRRARTWISRSLDDDLDEGTLLRLEEHVGSCAECRRHREVLLQGRTLLRGSEAEPSENFEWKVQLGIQRALRERAAEASAPEERRGSFWRPAMASAAAVALLVVGAGQMMLQTPEPAPNGGAASVLGTSAPASRVAEATPDLSGGVPGVPIELDATGSNFGIRTVGSLGDRFKGDLYAPVRREGDPRSTFPTAELFREVMGGTMPRVGAPGFLLSTPRGDGVQVLNLRIYGSTLRPSAGARDSVADGGTRVDPR